MPSIGSSVSFPLGPRKLCFERPLPPILVLASYAGRGSVLSRRNKTMVATGGWAWTTMFGQGRGPPWQGPGLYDLQSYVSLIVNPHELFEYGVIH